MGEIAGILPLIQGASSAAAGYSQYAASNAQGRYQRQVGNFNAQIAQQQAAEVEKAGKVAEGRRLVEGAQDASSARAHLAGQGVSVGSGSAARVQSDIQNAALEDAEQIRKNAALQAWGFGIDSINQRTRGRMGYIAGRQDGAQSLIQGGLAFTRGAGKTADVFDGRKPPAPKNPDDYWTD